MTKAHGENPQDRSAWKYDLDKMVLSPEEEALFTEESLAEAIEAAMKTIRQAQAIRGAAFSQVLPLRDMLLARFLLGTGGATTNVGEHDDLHVLAGGSTVVSEDVLDEARTYERLNHFAAQHELGVPDYVRLVSLATRLPNRDPALLTDAEIQSLLDVGATSPTSRGPTRAEPY